MSLGPSGLSGSEYLLTSLNVHLIVLRTASFAKLDVFPLKKSRYSSLIVNVSLYTALWSGRLEACSLNKSDLSWIDFVFNRFFL